MDLLKHGWLILKRRLPLLLVPVVLAVAGAFIYLSTTDREYTATTTLFLRAPDVKSSASAYQGNLFTVQRAQTYVNMVESDELAQLVVDKLGLNTSAHDLAARVEAVPIRDTVLITISVTDSTAQQAANLANTYGTEFATYVARVEAVQLAADVPPLVSTVKAAEAGDATADVWPLKILIPVAAVAGLIIGLILVFLAERFDTKLRSRKQIEDVTGNKVIGKLPQAGTVDADSIADSFTASKAFADAARVLSINAEHGVHDVNRSNGAPVLAVTSVNHGDGKSVAAAALATALAERGHRVGLLTLSSEEPSDEDGRPRQERTPARGRGSDSLQRRVVATNGAPTEQTLGAAIEELSQGRDFVVVDPQGAGLSAEVQVTAALSDAAVIVVQPSHTDEKSLTDLVDAIQAMDTPLIGVVTNKAKETNTASRYYA